ncbi:MAG: hypothetical protein GWN59_07135 [Calditrichae bacterium]|nr:hypothetical protein [Calditrichia bacterium]
MKSRSWPGNIRELENFVERLVALAPPNTRVLDVSVLPPDFRKEWQKLKRVLELDQSSRSLKESLAEHEEQIIRRALMDCDWNQSKAARLLKISEHGLRYKIGKFAIQKPIDK